MHDAMSDETELQGVAEGEEPVDAGASLDHDRAAVGEAPAEAVQTIDAAVGEGPAEAEETVDGLPVLAEVRTIEARPTGPIPAMQAAAVAATGFVAGAFAMAVAKRYGARKLAQSVSAAQTLPSVPTSTMRPVPHWPVGTSRTYLVNVRLIARPDE